MTPLDTAALLQSFESLHQDREEAALAFEAKQSLEMAYVARWSVIEASVKRVVHAEVCASLRLQLDEWQQFLDQPDSKAPNPIRHFPVDPTKAKLPTPNDLRARFSSASSLLELLDPNKKFRKKRNAIAHSAESFAKLATYEEYKAKVEAATIELRLMLSGSKPG